MTPRYYKGQILHHAIYGKVEVVEQASVPAFVRVKLLSRDGPRGFPGAPRNILAVGRCALREVR